MTSKPAENIDRAITLHFLKEFIFEINRVGMDKVMDVYRTMPEKDKNNFSEKISFGILQQQINLMRRERNLLMEGFKEDE